MKRFLLFAISIFTMATTMAQTKPTTYCFVEGEKPLYLDHYRAEGEGLHPCVLFAFGALTVIPKTLETSLIVNPLSILNCFNLFFIVNAPNYLLSRVNSPTIHRKVGIISLKYPTKAHGYLVHNLNMRYALNPLLKQRLAAINRVSFAILSIFQKNSP